MQEFPSWLPTVVLIIAAFLIGRWTARSSGRAPERYEAAPKPPYHPSSTSRSGAGVDGERLALLGRNGAGKTTLLKTLMGLIRPRAGTIRLGGQRIDGLPSFQVARAGIGYVPQGREVFAGFSVEENLLLGALSARSLDDVYPLFPALAERRRQNAGSLSGGQQQLLAIARVLLAKPRLLLLDEPSEGIQPSIVAEIGALIDRIAREMGLAVLLVEQNVELALGLCRRVAFMERGRITAEHDAAALQRDPAPLEAHLVF